MRISRIAAGSGLLLAAAAGACLPAAAAQAQAQAQEDPANGTEAVIGPPQLRNFSLTPRQRPATPPPAETRQEPQPAEPAPRVAEPPSPASPSPSRTAAERAPSPAPQPAEAAPAGPEPDLSRFDRAETPLEGPAAAAPESPPAAAPAEAAAGQSGLGTWPFALAAALLALLAFALVRRRRSRTEAAEPAASAAPAAPPPRPEPVLRPWLELELKAERTALTDEEASVNFELVVRNSGQAPARNVRIGARMFNAGVEQDKEIGSFFRTGSEERRTFTVPTIPPGGQGVIRGSVALKRGEIRPISVEGRPLFVPMVAVNAFYDWGEGQAGQTSRSYVVGRELTEPNAKMGPFRLDLGPRIWRTVGQRPHKLAKRV